VQNAADRGTGRNPGATGSRSITCASPPATGPRPGPRAGRQGSLWREKGRRGPRSAYHQSARFSEREPRGSRLQPGSPGRKRDRVDHDLSGTQSKTPGASPRDAPWAVHVGVLWCGPGSPVHEREWMETQAAADVLGVRLSLLEAGGARRSSEGICLGGQTTRTSGSRVRLPLSFPKRCSDRRAFAEASLAGDAPFPALSLDR
jgi:hypothetical protein